MTGTLTFQIDDSGHDFFPDVFCFRAVVVHAWKTPDECGAKMNINGIISIRVRTEFSEQTWERFLSLCLTGEEFDLDLAL